MPLFLNLELTKQEAIMILSMLGAIAGLIEPLITGNQGSISSFIFGISSLGLGTILANIIFEMIFKK